MSRSGSFDWITIAGRHLSLLEAGRTLDLDTLLVLGLCECGTWLDEHPDVPKPGKVRSWHAERNTEQPSRATIAFRERRSEAQLAFGSLPVSPRAAAIVGLAATNARRRRR